MLAAHGVPLAAQDNPDANAPADSQLLGTVLSPDDTSVPGATLRVIQTSTGKAWVTWTDENGKFEFPALPAGHFRVEISQIGFAPASKEIDLAPGAQTPINLKIDVGTLAAIAAPPAAENLVKAPNAPPSTEGAKSAPSEAAGGPATPNSNTAAANSGPAVAPGRGTNGGNGGPRGGGGRNGQGGGPGGYGQGGGRRAFQQVGLNGQSQNPADLGTEDQNIAEPGGQLGEAASADAVQMIGTVAMGQMPASGFPQPGDFGPDGRGGFGSGENAIPGQAAPAGFGGPGGPGGGGFGGGPGGGPGVFLQRGGGGGRGRGPQGGPQGVDALWGAQRVFRQRINRIHYSFYDTFGDSALNARPYSLYEANPPKISSWTESAGLNIGGPLKIPHVYDGTDKTFFYLNFGGTWARTPVDQFATVPTVAERNGDFSADNVQLYNPLSNLTGPRTLMTNAGCFQATPASPLPPAGTCIPTSLISQQAINLLNYIPMPNIPVTNVAGQNFNFHLQIECAGHQQSPECERHAPDFLEAELAGELQPEQRHLPFAE